jgi:hypothetical protein
MNKIRVQDDYEYLIAMLNYAAPIRGDSVSLLVERLPQKASLPRVSVAIVSMKSGETISLRSAPDCQLAVEGRTIKTAMQRLNEMCKEDFVSPRTLTRA